MQPRPKEHTFRKFHSKCFNALLTCCTLNKTSHDYFSAHKDEKIHVQAINVMNIPCHELMAYQ